MLLLPAAAVVGVIGVRQHELAVGRPVVGIALQPGGLFEDFDPANRTSAEEAIRAAREPASAESKRSSRRAAHDRWLLLVFAQCSCCDPRRVACCVGKRRVCRQALFRTRTGDPFLTMEVLYQLS